jgi:hypothetical protein
VSTSLFEKLRAFTRLLCNNLTGRPLPCIVTPITYKKEESNEQARANQIHPRKPDHRLRKLLSHRRVLGRRTSLGTLQRRSRHRRSVRLDHEHPRNLRGSHSGRTARCRLVRTGGFGPHPRHPGTHGLMVRPGDTIVPLQHWLSGAGEEPALSDGPSLDVTEACH